MSATSTTASTATLPADHQHRSAALNPKRSICVTAPAGSGKTELLSQRVLKLLATVDQPEEILAITFTRKAAGEMHHRILSALHHAAKEPKPEAPHKQLSWQLAREALAQDQGRGWNLLENPSRLKVQTIDSLCASLTRQMPVLSSFGAQPQVTEQASLLYRQAVRQLLSRLEADNALASALETLLDHVDNDYSKVERLLTGMLQNRDQWLLHLGTGGNIAAARHALQATLKQINEDLLKQMVAELAIFSGELIPLFDYAGVQLQAAHSESPIAQLAGITALPAAEIDALPVWRGIVELLITKGRNPGYRKRLDKNCGFPTQTHEGDKDRAKQLKQAMVEQLAVLSERPQLLSYLAEFNQLPAVEYSDRQWQLMQALLGVLPVLAAELKLSFQQQGQVDFAEIAIAALQSLGDSLSPSELALRLDYQLRHILIDEFQDTSSTQFRLLERLTDGWAEHNADNTERPNTLFLVGDGMQSIYGFREANVGLFLEARRRGVNGIQLDDLPLSVNFRSVSQVVEWNNRVFSRAFPSQENLSRGAVPYEDAVAFSGESEASVVEVTGFLGDEAVSDEAVYLADTIVETQQSYPDETIGVLVRSRNHLQAVVAELSKRDIPWTATDIDSLKNYACVQDLLTLTKAMSNIADRLSWVALLRTPWFGLNNNDLYWLLGQDRRQAVWCQLQDWQQHAEQLSPHTLKCLPKQLALLSNALAARQRFSVREWLSGLWVGLGGPAGLQDAREFEMVDSFFSLLDKYSEAGRMQSLSEFEANIERLYAQPQNPNCPLQLMTIHKSKGLEFDTVILPGLSRAPRSDDRSLLMWREYLSSTNKTGSDTLGGLVISPLPAAGQNDSIYDYLRYEQSQNQLLESTRLLYVAATRAVKRLYLSFSTELDDKTESPKAPANNSLLATIWPVVQEDVQWQESKVPNARGQLGFDLQDIDAAQTDSQLQRLQKNWQPPEWHFPNPLAAYYLAADFDGENIPELEEDPVASIVGTTVHKIFETITRHGLGIWLEQSHQQRQQWLEALLTHFGLSLASDREAALSQVHTAVENTLTDSKGRWLLSEARTTDHTELAVSSLYQDKIRHRVVDRVLRDDLGQLWIVDYKTNRPLAGETNAEFVRRCTQQYRGQLRDYQWHISRVLQETSPIRMALYFTAIPQFKEID